MITPRLLASMFIAAMLLLSGCYQASQSDAGSVDRVLELIVESPVDGPVDSTNSLTQTRAYIPSNLRLVVTIDERQVSTVRTSDGDYQVVGEFGSSFNLKIDWFETVDSNEIQLVTYSRFINSSAEGRLIISKNDYDSDSFDMDGDSDSNLYERTNNTDPFNSNKCSLCPINVDVNIWSIHPSEAPEIDGGYDDVWAKAQFKDLEGDLSLRISSLDAGEDLAYESGSDFRWAAMHDAAYLYILFLGELSPYQTPLDGDSLLLTMESGQLGESSYVSRSHFFKVFDTNGNLSTMSNPPSGEVAADLAICLCEGSQTLWEMRIPLDSVFPDTATFESFQFSISYGDETDGEGSYDFFWIDRVDALLRL